MRGPIQAFRLTQTARGQQRPYLLQVFCGSLGPPPPPQDPSPIATQEMRKGSGGVPGGTSGRPSLHSSPEPSSLIFTVLSALESLTSFAALTFSPSTSRGSPPPSELLSVRKGVGTKLKKKRKKAPSPQHHTYRRRQRKGSPGPGSPWTSKLSMG